VLANGSRAKTKREKEKCDESSRSGGGRDAKGRSVTKGRPGEGGVEGQKKEVVAEAIGSESLELSRET